MVVCPLLAGSRLRIQWTVTLTGLNQAQSPTTPLRYIISGILGDSESGTEKSVRVCVSERRDRQEGGRVGIGRGSGRTRTSDFGTDDRNRAERRPLLVDFVFSMDFAGPLEEPEKNPMGI